MALVRGMRTTRTNGTVATVSVVALSNIIAARKAKRNLANRFDIDPDDLEVVDIGGLVFKEVSVEME